MHTHIESLSIAALALFVGTPVSAQIQINEGQTLTQSDLLAGSFLGQPFTLGPDLTFDINSGGTMGPIGDIDLLGATVRVNGGGTYLDDRAADARGLLNLRMVVNDGAELPDGVRGGAGSDIRVLGGTLGGALSAIGADASIEMSGGEAELVVVLDGASGAFSGGRRRGMVWFTTGSMVFTGADFWVGGAPAAPGVYTVDEPGAIGGVHPDGSVFIHDNSALPSATASPGLELGTVELVGAAVPTPSTDSFVVPPDAPPPGGLRPGQTLRLGEGGALPADYRVLDADLIVTGPGQIDGLRAVSGRTTLDADVFTGLFRPRFYGVDITVDSAAIFGPFVAEPFLAAGTTLELIAGDLLDAYLSASSATVATGSVTGETLLKNGSSVEFVGSDAFAFARDVWVVSDSVVSVSGAAHIDIDCQVAGGSRVELAAGEFAGYAGVGSPAAFEMSGGLFSGELVSSGGARVLGGRSTGDITITDGGTLELGEGAEFAGRLTSAGNTRVTIDGGSVDSADRFTIGSLLEMDSGSLRADVELFPGATFVQTGGSVNGSLDLFGGSLWSVSGGEIGEEIRAFPGSAIDLLIDSPYRLGGRPNRVGRDERVEIDERGVLLEATLADTTPVLFDLLGDLLFGGTYIDEDATVTLVGVPVTPCNVADVSEPFGLLDLADIAAFVRSFVAMSVDADINSDGVVDLGDVTWFVDVFTSGCGF